MSEPGLVFNEVPELYDRARPGYPAELFADLADLADLGPGSPVLEVGAGTGHATQPLAGFGCAVTALEPGADMVAVARRRVGGYPNVTLETSTFEDWDARGARFDAVVAASSWHWVDPAIGWRRAHELLKPGGRLALVGNVVFRKTDEPEVYAETADLHEQFAPGDPAWGHPPLEDEARAAPADWSDRFEQPTVLWYPAVQWLDGAGFADMLRTNSPYRKLAPAVREPLLDAIADRIRTRMGDRAARRYLTVLRVGRAI
ncbi:class I SAM-dependent methyltransferase [Actinoplanes sp. NPDC026619]|uniref:class I SAM-dependent methyltransferase n=1 Tax=Actinoplanes sp. NPDC026619 TaxID=3155798 RepID=UPI0033E34312